MAMRELVSGGAACAVPGSSSSSNPLGALANVLAGSSSKTKVKQINLQFGSHGFFRFYSLEYIPKPFSLLFF